MSFVLSNLHVNNLSNDMVSTIKKLADDVLLSFITLNAKTWAYEAVFIVNYPDRQTELKNY